MTILILLAKPIATETQSLISHHIYSQHKSQVDLSNLFKRRLKESLVFTLYIIQSNVI